VAVWQNDSQTVPIDLGPINTTQNLTFAGHEVQLLLLSNITASPPPKSTRYHFAANVTLTGIAADASVAFSSIHANSSGLKRVGLGRPRTECVNCGYWYGEQAPSFYTVWGIWCWAGAQAGGGRGVGVKGGEVDG
jgi:hypothetical protein